MQCSKCGLESAMPVESSQPVRCPDCGGYETRYMRAYYHEFDPTGVDAIDAILEAVALAGKAYHHTGEWGDENVQAPNGFWELIQERANEAARLMESN